MYLLERTQSDIAGQVSDNFLGRRVIVF